MFRGEIPFACQRNVENLSGFLLFRCRLPVDKTMSHALAAIEKKGCRLLTSRRRSLVAGTAKTTSQTDNQRLAHDTGGGQLNANVKRALGC